MKYKQKDIDHITTTLIASKKRSRMIQRAVELIIKRSILRWW